MDREDCNWDVTQCKAPLQITSEDDVGQLGVAVGIRLWLPGVGEVRVDGFEGIVARVWNPAVRYGRDLQEFDIFIRS